MRTPALAALASALLVLLPALAGCIGGDAGDSVDAADVQAPGASDGAADPLHNATNATPPEPLAEPLLQVMDASGVAVTTTLPKEALTFRAELPPSAGVNGTEDMRFVWNLGDGSVLEGREVTHSYQEPGAKPVRLTVEDAAGRRAQANTTVGVTLLEYFRDTIVLGTAGQKLEKPRDHQEHVIDVPEGATLLALTLTWDANSNYGGVVLPHGLNKLHLELIDEAGAPVAVEGAAPERIALAAPAAGRYVAVVVGDEGAFIPYLVASQVEFVEAAA